MPSLEIKHTAAEHFTYDYWCQSFPKVVFKKTEVEMIENNNLHYKYIKESKNIMRWFDLCTHDNICSFVPQLIYVICKYGNRRANREFTDADIIKEMGSEDISSLICSHEDRKSWFMPLESIWPLHLVHNPSTVRKRHKKNLSGVEAFIDEQKISGIKDKKTLARLVDDKFPNLLTNAEMGRLFPANAGTVISIGGQRQQGKRLRGII